jgi:hydrogenase maturation protease
MAPRIVLFGYGNASRGDDALGPALVACAHVWLGDHPEAEVAVLEDYQLQVEHALDVADADLVLFVDADASCRAPFCRRRVERVRDVSYTSHELSPAAVLHVVKEVTGKEPPPAFVLGVRGERFGLGDELSPQAEAHLEAAWSEVEALLENPSVEAWNARTCG